MPEEDAREKDTRGEDARGEDTREEDKKKSSGKFNLSSIIRWTGIVAAILVASYFVVEKVATPVLSPENTSGKTTESLSSQTEEEKIGPIYEFEPIIVNLNEEGARRYLKVSMSLEVNDAEVIKEIELLKPRLLDCLITLLSSKTLEDIEGAKGKENLRREIVAEVNRYLNRGIVVNAYFGEFIIQ